MQSLPKRTSTDLALSLLNIHNIEYEIDYRKLIFLGQLCCLPSEYRAKEIFLHRLINFNSKVSLQQGFIPDIYRILGKYSLTETVYSFVNSGLFFSKLTWKRLVRDRVCEISERNWVERVQSAHSVRRILNINETNKMYIFWEVSKRYPSYLKLVQNAVNLLGRMFSRNWYQKCRLCGNFIFSETEHLLLFCHRMDDFRNILWERLYIRFSVDFFVAFTTYPPEKQIDLLFSGCREILGSEGDIVDCIKIFIVSLGKARLEPGIPL